MNDKIEQRFGEETVGLVTKAEFIEKRRTIAERTQVSEYITFFCIFFVPFVRRQIILIVVSLSFLQILVCLSTDVGVGRSRIEKFCKEKFLPRHALFLVRK